MSHTNRFLDLARIMIKQAKLLKKQGLAAEARALARRAWAINVYGHTALQFQPVRIRR